jgi:hypothetical protein
MKQTPLPGRPADRFKNPSAPCPSWERLRLDDNIDRPFDEQVADRAQDLIIGRIIEPVGGAMIVT